MRKHNKINLTGRKVLVAGLGLSGLWAARYLAGQGAIVTVSEQKTERDIDPKILREIRELGGSLEAGGHSRDTFLNAEMIILSPGVPHDMDLLRAAANKDIPVTGELELASRLIETPMIAVTGTNGKSTVTAFLGLLLEYAGFNCFIGGNIGTPLTAYAVGGKSADYAVVEVSSFQLDTIDSFCPFISLILNISPDHLDRYPDYESYIQSKLRIFKNQAQGHYLILNDDDKRLSLVSPPSGVLAFRYGIEEKKGRHAFIKNNRIRACTDDKKTHTFSLESLSLPGKHNQENALSVVLCGLTLGIESSVIQKTINQFKGLPNRIEKVADIDGIVFYNDSKATNVDAAVRAIESLDRSIILISGGRNKGVDFGPLVRAAQEKVKRAIFLGESKELLAKSFDGVLPFSFAVNMEEAVTTSFSFAKRGDGVLLAPACSSFDMFSDYSHRGMVFKAAVKRLVNG